MAEICVNMYLYSLEDAEGTDISGDVGIDWGIDSDNDIWVKCDNHVFISLEDKALLDKAKELTQEDWNLIELNKLLEDK